MSQKREPKVTSAERQPRSRVTELGFLLCLALNLTVWGKNQAEAAEVDPAGWALRSTVELRCSFSGGQKCTAYRIIMTTLKLEGPNGQFLLATNKTLLQKVPCLENPGMESRPANSQGINRRMEEKVEGSGEACGAHQPGHLQTVEHMFITCQDLQNSKLLGI